MTIVELVPLLTEVESSVDDDSDDGRDESSVETGDTVGGEGLLVNIDETVELSGSSDLGGLVVVGESGSGVVERVNKEERRGSGGSSGSDVSGEPDPVALRLLEPEQGLEVVLEGEVERLSGEVSDHVGGVSSPEGGDSLVGVRSPEAVPDTGVRGGKSALLDPEKKQIRNDRSTPAAMEDVMVWGSFSPGWRAYAKGEPRASRDRNGKERKATLTSHPGSGPRA